MQALAAIMKHRWMYFLLFFALLGTAWAQRDSAPAPKSGATESPSNRIISLRSSQQEGKVRLVVETTNAPDYQVYQSGEHTIIEVFDALPCQVQPDKIRSRRYVRNWQVSNPAIGLFRWDVAGRYALPAEQCRVEVLDNPSRLVVDLYTKWVEDEHYNLTSGVSWHRRQYFGQVFPYLLWNQVVFDPKDEHITLDIGFGKDSTAKCEAVSSLVSRKKALVGINGGYFNMSGGALGLVVRQGKVVSPHVSRRPPRSVFALTKDKKAAFARAKAVNGQVMTLDNRVWPNIDLALGGGPRLISNGAMQLTTDAEALGINGNDITRSCGRTAVSADSKGRIALSTASGYSDSHSEGLKLDQMATLLLRSGAVDAVNLDGGGSVDMAIQGHLVAHGPEAGTYERPVANALLVYDDRPSVQPADIKIQIDNREVLADGKSSYDIIAFITDEKGNPVNDGTPVFFSAPGFTTSRALTTNGQAHASWKALRLTNPLTITVKSGFASAQASITLNSDSPERLLARWYRTIKTSPVLSIPSSPSSEPTPATPTPSTPTPMFDFGDGKALTDDEDDSNSPTITQNTNAPTVPIEANPSSATSSNATQMQVIDFRGRLVDKWYNGVANKTVELWQGERQIGSYTTDKIGEIRATVMLPLDVNTLELHSEGLAPVQMVF